MLVGELHSGECYELLARLGFGRLACARDSQPYIVPIYFAYERRVLLWVRHARPKNQVDALEPAGGRRGR
jgi:nitroimidazol reductase NimA-like FMN-containing flavoprotein (pyridoxamine 5'-phosphate oxidase superfamily)